MGWLNSLDRKPAKELGGWSVLALVKPRGIQFG
jgi:hypothetical protein